MQNMCAGQRTLYLSVGKQILPERYLAAICHSQCSNFLSFSMPILQNKISYNQNLE